MGSKTNLYFKQPLGNKRLISQQAMNLRIFVLFVLTSAIAMGQDIAPRIAYIYPAGGKRGTSFELIAGGQYLRGVTNIFFSGSGITGTVIEHIEPISQRQAQLLRDQLRELEQKRAQAMKKRSGVKWTAEDQKTLEEIRKKLANFIPPRELNPALAEIVKVRISIAPDAEPGEREVRFQTAIGLSNPNVFYVGDLDEYTRRHRRILRQGKEDRDPVVTLGEGEVRVTLPVTLNGQIMPGGVDKYRFSAKKGQKIVIQTLARQLIPYIPDAVPGWFQAIATLYDSKGKELARVDDFQFNPDPVLYYEIPETGDYVFEIRDAIYRGREDFIYRVTIGELPFLTGIFPAGGCTGKRAQFELAGWNLPTNKIALELPDITSGIYQLKLYPADLANGAMSPKFVLKNESYGMEDSAVLVHVCDLPEIVEREANNSIKFAQDVNLPVIINGKISADEDVDSFRFSAKKGDKIVAEVLARRLNSPLDSIVQLVDEAGNVVAFNDDFMDKTSGLTTHHADSYLIATIPADGVYFIRIASAQRRGGDEFVYRLRISNPRPDFEVRVFPSEINLREGGCNDFTVYALRKDGFDGEISLSIKSAPPGFKLDGGRIPSGKDTIRATITSPQKMFGKPIKIVLQASAVIDGKTVTKEVVPSREMMQAFAYNHLVPVSEFLVWVRSINPQRFQVRLVGETPVKIRLGATTRVQFEGAPMLKEFANLALSEPPEGIVLKDVVARRFGFELVLYAEPSKVKPGIQDNLIVEISPRPLAQANNKSPQNLRARRITLGTLPAIPIEVVQ